MKTAHRLAAWVWIALFAAACGRATPTTGWLEPVQNVAPGVELYRTTDATLVEPPAPVSAFLLRLDPVKIRLESALANGEVMGAERVDAIAARHGAVAAVNGGFFNTRNGEPVGLLKVAGELVSDAAATKGGVVVRETEDGRTTLVFDRISARVVMTARSGDRTWTVPIDGVDTTRVRGRLMLYTPAYHPDTDTAPNGTEWVLDGAPLRVVDIQSNVGRARIPRAGMTLSFGGLDLPADLADLVEGVEVSFRTEWQTAGGVPVDHLESAAHIVQGAGLLRRAGEVIRDWSVENLRADTFTEMRHPRTMIGVDQHGFIWLTVVDGRQPDHSVGMTFADLQRLSDRLSLTDALNLDGGGSTTMVVQGKIVNRPSDPTGPRPVSDAILVTSR
ncbi:MAG: phosphodiester glycosidase family protein [Vicinamibacterales bacterium]